MEEGREITVAGSKEINDVGKTATFIKNDTVEIPTVFSRKLSTPGSFSIPCIVGNVEIERTLCDLGASVSLMPYSLFHKFNLGLLQGAVFSLQLADSSEMQPIGKLEDVPVNIGDIWVLEDFIIVDMLETDDAQIILGRPFMATTDCHIDVKRGQITFELQECYAMFCHIE